MYATLNKSNAMTNKSKNRSDIDLPFSSLEHDMTLCWIDQHTRARPTKAEATISRAHSFSAHVREIYDVGEDGMRLWASYYTQITLEGLVL